MPALRATPAAEDPRGQRPRAVPSPEYPQEINPLSTAEDGVAWLVVLGTGSWGYGSPTGEFKLDRYGQPTDLPVVVPRLFLAGLHWVNQETVDQARSAGSPNLMVLDEKPVLIRRTIRGPLSKAHLRLPSDGAVTLAQSESQGTELVEEQHEVPYDYPCGNCPQRFPSAGARDRHVSMNHTTRAFEPLPPQDPTPPEPALTDA